MLLRAEEKQKARKEIESLERAMRSFQMEIGRLPTNLVELVRTKYITAIPKAKDGTRIYYDPLRGHIYHQKIGPRQSGNYFKAGLIESN